MNKEQLIKIIETIDISKIRRIEINYEINDVTGITHNLEYENEE